MAITLKQALKIGGLRKCDVVAGKQGLDCQLNYVTIMEVPDIVRWLKGKELLITSLYPIKDDQQAINNLVKELHAKGTSALAIKAHRFIEEIPQVILEEAEKYNFPIIEIPEEVSYLDILSPVMNVIFDEKVVIQEDLEQAYKLLDEIKLNKWTTQQFIETLTHLMKYDIRIDSFVPYFNMTTTSEYVLASLTDEEIRELEIIQRPTRLSRWNETLSVKQDCIIAPVMIEGRMFGAITSMNVEKEFLEVDLAILERATTMLSIEFMRKKASYELEQQYKSDFFRELLFSPIQHEDSMLEKGRMHGFDLNKKYYFLSLQFMESEKGITFIADLVSHLELICSKFDSNIIIGAMQNNIFLLYPSINKTRDRMDQDFHSIYKEMKRKVSGDLYIGVGSIATELNDIVRGYQQANQAVIIGRTLYDSKSIIFYQDLGFYRLLAEIKDTNEIKKFYNESLGSLIEYDKHHDLELVQTLQVYFKNNESISKTAKELYIHINTMKYRLQRIKVISNLHVKNAEDKLNLQIGLKIHNFIKKDYRFR
ncbi:PucR family transcriptional regulator [Paraliobacillus sediminis]|uniref:PucR family transcriptional regulator n=1 Tax=Paraliobacillus sediminis TaxID=1885916 RepID=UPI000E3C8976|nr:PucR family transcriptional regulator [Paraliobacillus sediminis]